MRLQQRVLNLQSECYKCQKCPLGTKQVDGLDPHVFASGNPLSPFMFVAEAPGAEEVIKKMPLVGRSGQFFENKILTPAGLNRKGVYITNSVLCRPNEKNRTPFFGEIEDCLPHLDAQVLLVSPKLIITMGNAPLYAVCDEIGITKNRGKLRWSRVWSNEKRIPVLPMFHPAYCLRNSGLGEMRQDVELLSQLVKDVNSKKEIL